MKTLRPYREPTLTTYGTIRVIMKAFGGPRLIDSIFNSDGTLLADGEGSIEDGILVPGEGIVPCSEAPQPEVCS